MKILGISGKGAWFVGNTEEDGKWYVHADNVKNFAKNFKRGDEVEIKSETSEANGRTTNTITFVKGIPHTASSPESSTTPTKSYGKSPEEQASIKKQAIGKMSAISLTALQGTVDINNIHDIIKAIYKTYEGLIG